MTSDPTVSDQERYPEIDTSRPHSARIWNYLLGGTDNFPADREVGDRVIQVYPALAEYARAARAFLVRVVRYLAGEAGIRQFLDIGTGLPTVNNTHEVAQAIAPECRIVYVDNDPLVLVHARALLTSTAEGVADYLDADVRDTDTILREAARTLDFNRPIALIMLGILGNVPDYGEARSIVKRLFDAVPSGSYLIINDGTNTSEQAVAAAQVSSDGGYPYKLRSRTEIASFFQGWEFVPPGVVSTPLWRPEAASSGPPPAVLDLYCGVARKP